MDSNFFTVVTEGIRSEASRPLAVGVVSLPPAAMRDLGGLSVEKAREYLDQRVRYEREQSQRVHSFGSTGCIV